MAIACAEFFRTAFLKKKPFLFLEVVLSFLLFLLPSYTVHKCALFCIEYIDIYRGGLILHKHRVCFPLTPTPGIQHFHFVPNHSLCSSVHSLAFLSTHSSPQPPSPVPSASSLAHIHLFVLHKCVKWCSQQLQLPVHPSSGLLYNRQRMLVCVCAWEVLRSREDKAKEDQGVMQVFIAGKTLQRALEKAAQAQEWCWWGVVGPAESGEQGLFLVLPSLGRPQQLQGAAQLCTACSFFSALPWQRAGGGTAAQALQAPFSTRKKRAPAFNSISRCLCSGEYGNMNPLLLSPWGLFMLLSSLPPTPNTLHVLPGLSASYLKQVTPRHASFL